MNQSISELVRQPIPTLDWSTDWKFVPIQECAESLVPLTSAFSQSIKPKPQYIAMGIPHALNICYIRQGVADKLRLLAELLCNINLTLVIWDAWRPVAVQQALYDAFKADLRVQYPNISEEELDKKTQIFVSLPSRDPSQPSPHLTGGAIDLTLGDSQGQVLDMGTEFDDFSKVANTAYYEILRKQRPLTESEVKCQKNRRLLFHLMKQVGFTNYPAEWWHYDFGDQFWGAISSQVAIYGPTEPGT